MMWETKSLGEEINFYDFKYINGRSVYGLMKPAIFSRENLKQLFNLYDEKTGSVNFP